jgi:protein-tyrosine-phosphatase/DNA-binding transcriptional ArsR family regulator
MSATNPEATGDQTPQVVFACVRNGGRSVIGRVLTEHYAHGRVRALSAGTQPGEHIHPEVAEALQKLGLDTSKEHPKVLTRETVAASDMAITLGCGEECPYVPGVKYVDWPVADPEARTRRPCAASSPTSTAESGPCSPNWFLTSSSRHQFSHRAPEHVAQPTQLGAEGGSSDPSSEGRRPLGRPNSRTYVSSVAVSKFVELTAPSSSEVGEHVAVLTAAADPTRWTILQRLARGQTCVCDLQAEVAVAPNLLSYHLKVLRDAGLVTCSRRGRWVDYRLCPDATERLTAALPGGGERSRPLSHEHSATHNIDDDRYAWHGEEDIDVDRNLGQESQRGTAR